MAYYNICPKCKCNLDPGEKCDCDRERREQEEFYRKKLWVSRTGQMKFVFGEKEVGYADKVAY